MYISEHVVHIRQQLTTVGRAHKSTFFFSPFFDNDDVCVCARAQRVHIQNNAQRVKRRSSPSVRSFASLFLTVIVVYCRQNSSFFVYIFFIMTSVKNFVKSIYLYLFFFDCTVSSFLI